MDQKNEVERLMSMLKQGRFSTNEEVIQLTNQVGQLRKAIASTATTITENTTTLNDYDGSESISRISNLASDRDHDQDHADGQYQDHEKRSNTNPSYETVQEIDVSQAMQVQPKIQRQSNFNFGEENFHNSSTVTLPENVQLGNASPFASPEIRTFKDVDSKKNYRTKIVTVNLPAPDRSRQVQSQPQSQIQNIQNNFQQSGQIQSQRRRSPTRGARTR